MTRIDCAGLELRWANGKVLCSEIADFLIGDGKSDDTGEYHEIVLSLRHLLRPRASEQIVIWNTSNNSAALWFTVTQAEFDLTMGASKIEGRVDIR